MGDFASAYGFSSKREGGLSTDPLDRGGETKYGISTGTFESQKEKGTIDRSMKNVKGLSRGQAEKILREYWDKIRGDELPRDVSIALFDTALLFGPQKAIHMLQKILKVKQDGRMGPDTLEAVRNYKGDLVEEFLRARLQAHEDDVKENNEQQRYIRGWRDRVARLRHYLRPEAPAQQGPAGKNPYAPPAGKNPPGPDKTPSASSPFSAFSYLDLAGRPNALGPIDPAIWDPSAPPTGQNSATPNAYLGPVGRPNALGPIPPMWDPSALPAGENRLAGHSPLNLPPASANQPFQHSPSGVTGAFPQGPPAPPSPVPTDYPTWPLPSDSPLFPRRNLLEPAGSMSPWGQPQSRRDGSLVPSPRNVFGPRPGTPLEGSPDLPQSGSPNVFKPLAGL